MSQSKALYRAALKGNWDDATKLLQTNESLIRTPLTKGGEIALHIAVLEGHTFFVSKLLEKMTLEEVEITNKKGCTSLCFAAATGHTDIARIMVSGRPSLPAVCGENGVRPLYMAALQGYDEMANFLYPISEFESWTPKEQIDLLTTAISSELYGLAMSIVGQHKRLAVAKDSNGETPLIVLARNPSTFPCNNRRPLWVRIMNNALLHDTNAQNDAHKLFDCLWNAIDVISQGDIEAARGEEDVENAIEVVSQEDTEAARGEEDRENAVEVIHHQDDLEAYRDAETDKLFFMAAESGNDDFLVELFRRDHNILYKINESKHSIFHIAVLHRYVKVFNLMHELTGTKDLIVTYIDTDGNNILHLAAMLAPKNQLNCIPGAALQMQREVLWYKEVEKLVRPSYKKMKNNAGQTPHELFLAEHESLMKEGEKFMKQTAKSCMLVTMLIATVVFTTAFTVPGGYNNNTGDPILENKRMFMVFPVSESVATLSSLTSMLVFLSILTSRYSDEDFLSALPSWLVVGVVSLFFSIVAMMVAFCSCLLFFEHGWATKMLLLGFFSSVPTMFVVLKYPLLKTILRCTISGTWLFRSYNRLHA